MQSDASSSSPAAQPNLASQAWFSTTHWSVVLAAGSGDARLASEALEKLCRDYWPPVYAYIRRTGRSPEDARDLTQAFFVRLLERDSFALADPDRGRFRSFLLTSLQHFLASEFHRSHARKRGGGREVISFDAIDPELRYALEPVETETPETLFERRWALALLDKAVASLREEYAATGRGPMFDQLKCYIWGEKNTATCTEIASELDLTEEAVKKALQRLRQRFGEKLRSQIAHTVSSPADVDAELRHLAAVLRS